jgi:CheY-like chemotaxis protein
MENDPSRFEEHLRAALINLYNPSVLRRSPLVGILGIVQPAGASQVSDLASTLRRTLIEAMEALRPGEETPHAARSWRIYQVLRRRYIEQSPQLGVAQELGLSLRQLQREENRARQALIDWLSTMYGLTPRPMLVAAAEAVDDHPDGAQPGEPATGLAPREERVLTRAEELDWLRISAQTYVVEIGELLDEVLATAGPILAEASIVIQPPATIGTPRVALKADILRQALLNVLTTIVGVVPYGRVQIESETLPGLTGISIWCDPAGGNTREANLSPPARRRENLAEAAEMARELMEVCGGRLEMFPSMPDPEAGGHGDETILGAASAPTEPTGTSPSAGRVLFARLMVPVVEELPVLVVDDNADALRLFERCLMGSRYQFVGARDGAQAMAAVEEFRPRAVILDVMMPKQDGWALLHRLREHPQMAGVPVVVATILPQEQFALTLGAAAFLRKPVSRTQLLAMLDHLTDQPAPQPL